MRLVYIAAGLFKREFLAAVTFITYIGVFSIYMNWTCAIFAFIGWLLSWKIIYEGADHDDVK